MPKHQVDDAARASPLLDSQIFPIKAHFYAAELTERFRSMSQVGPANWNLLPARLFRSPFVTDLLYIVFFSNFFIYEDASNCEELNGRKISAICNTTSRSGEPLFGISNGFLLHRLALSGRNVRGHE